MRSARCIFPYVPAVASAFELVPLVVPMLPFQMKLKEEEGKEEGDRVRGVSVSRGC